MRTITCSIGLCAILCLASAAGAQQPAPPATQPGVGRFPFIEVDVRSREVRVECQTLLPRMPLEFFCVTAGGSEHESLLRTRAKPSHIHASLLMLGLSPGEGIRYSESTKKWLPPHGPPLSIWIEYMKDGKSTRVPGTRFIRDVRDQKPAPAMSWVFTGSRLLEDGAYAADITGYVVTMVNFELSLIDIPRVAGEAQETLEWEVDPSAVPPVGTAVTMILQPLGNAPAAGNVPVQSPPTSGPASDLSPITTDQQLIQRLRERWNTQVRPHAQALEQAAKAQYEVILALRHEQQRLIDEADRIQRLIDQLEQEWQQMTAPRPEQR